MCYFTWKQELVLNILWVIVGTTSRRGKVPIFKPIAPSFKTVEFAYINLFSKENRPSFWFPGGPRSEEEMPVSVEIYAVFGGDLPRTKTGKFGSLKSLNLNILSFKSTHVEATSGQSTWRIWI